MTWVLPTIIAFVGGLAGWFISATFGWLPQQRDFEQAVKKHLPAKPSPADYEKAEAAVESTGLYKPSYWREVWNTSVLPLVVYVVVLPAGKAVGGTSLSMLTLLGFVLVVFVLAAIHENVWKERGPTRFGVVRVVILWLMAGLLTAWVNYGATPLGPETGTEPANGDKPRLRTDLTFTFGEGR